MTSHYNLYESLGLSRERSCEELEEELTRRIDAHLAEGGSRTDAFVDEASTGRAIFGDKDLRQLHDARLDDPKATPLSIAALHELAAARGEGYRDASRPDGEGRPARRGRTRIRRTVAIAAPPESLRESFAQAPVVVRALGIAGGIFGIFTVVMLAYFIVNRFRAQQILEMSPFMVDPQVMAQAMQVMSMTLLLGSVFMVMALHGWVLAAVALRGSHAPAWWAGIATTVTLLLFVGLLWPMMTGNMVILPVVLATYLIIVLVLLVAPDTREWFRGRIRVVEVQDGAAPTAAEAAAEAAAPEGMTGAAAPKAAGAADKGEATGGPNGAADEA